jgi:hypothetical protein
MENFLDVSSFCLGRIFALDLDAVSSSDFARDVFFLWAVIALSCTGGRSRIWLCGVWIV